VPTRRAPAAPATPPGPASDGERARGVRWDLTRLYADPNDPRLATDAAEARTRAERFAGRWRGATAGGDAAAVREAIAEYEAILELGRRPAFYASLLAAADGCDPVALDLEQRTLEAETELRNQLVFFEIELGGIEAARAHDPLLAPYRHYLDQLRRFQPHRLTEPEERALARKDVSGRAAFVQLYDELSASLRFEVGGETLTEGETFALLHHPDRERRGQALTGLLAAFAAQVLPLTAIMNALLLDHRLECELRGYADAIAPTHLENAVEPAVVETMMDAVERRSPLMQEFFRLKARLLGLPRLTVADVYAPLGAAATTVPFAVGRDLVLDAFARFDPGVAEHARAFFAEARLDAEVRPGKRPGAFCAALGPHDDAYILASYAGTTRDVATLAHELGHGVHDALARRQTFLSYDPPLVLAETASVFAEMLVTDHLLATAPDAATRRRILVETLDEIYGTVFRQHALTRFELAAHQARRTHRVSADELGDLWTAEQRRLLGDAVELTPAYRHGWTYIPHFVHSRFYCYAYAFGELFALALFQRYKERGPRFVPEYLELLASGGGTEPAALAARLGFDLAAPSFWDAGCAVVAARLEELKRSL
jgi:oligoendopeptidase F